MFSKTSLGEANQFGIEIFRQIGLRIYFVQSIPLFEGIFAGIDKNTQNNSKKEFNFVASYFVADLRVIKKLPFPGKRFHVNTHFFLGKC